MPQFTQLTVILKALLLSEIPRKCKNYAKLFGGQEFKRKHYLVVSSGNESRQRRG